MKNQPNDSGDQCPQKGDEYWAVGYYGHVVQFKWKNDGFDKGLMKHGNVYRTRKDSEIGAIRDRGMRVKNTRVKGEEFWVWGFGHKKPCRSEWWGTYFTQPKFAIKEEAQAWGDEFAEAFIYCDKL